MIARKFENRKTVLKSKMEDSGAILCQISYLKDALDQVNEEIEADIQITREIESEIVKCSEFETALAAKESDLTRSLYVSWFELVGLLSVTKDLRSSVEKSETELGAIRSKKEEILNRISENRERFVEFCVEFQKEIENNVVRGLLSEKESLQNEMFMLDEKNDALKNSMMAFIDGILEDLNSVNSALWDEIQKTNQENVKSVKDIDDMKTLLSSSFSYDEFKGAGSWTLQ